LLKIEKFGDASILGIYDGCVSTQLPGSRFQISAMNALNANGSLIVGTKYLISFVKTATGSTGSSGTSGVGSPGSSGTSGGQGPMGNTGSSGTSGAQGPAGPSGGGGSSGSSGETGSSGTSGAQGPAGPSGGGGSSGSSGETGTSGSSGSSGTSGFGTSGSSGSSGTSGFGTSGSSGTAGTSGLGTSGSSGSSGIGTSGSSGSSSDSSQWCPINVSAASSSVIVTNSDVTSYVKVGLPIKYSGDTMLYGIVTGVTYSGGSTYIGVDGPSCNTTIAGANTFIGQPYMLHTETFAVNGAYADGDNDTLLLTDTKTYWKWFTNSAYLVRFNVRHVTDASTTNPKVNLVVNGNSVSSDNSDSGITVGTLWSSSLVTINSSNYQIGFDDSLEIKTNADAGTTHASDLTVQTTFVMIPVDCNYL
jgi:hypothetical protein